MNEINETKAVSIDEAARLLGIGRTLAYELVHRGDIPSIQLGGRVVVPLKRLDALLAGSGAPEKTG